MQNSISLTSKVLKGKNFIHLMFGFLPAFILFIYGLFLLRVFHRIGIFPANHVYSSANPISYIIISFTVLFIFLYFIYLAFFELKIRDTKDFYAILFLIILVCIVAVGRGPFFQPPSDPIFHSGLMWDYLGANTFDTENRAIITKSIFATMYFFSDPILWSSRLNIVLAIHTICILFLIISCYVSSRLYGLNFKWSFFSSFVFSLFFGTNQFSYLSYYSLAPTSINLSFVWLISSLLFRNAFHFRVSIFHYLKISYISSIGLLITPMLYYNHKQEAGFLLFVYFLAYSIFISKSLSIKSSLLRYRKKIILLLLLILFFPFGLLSRIGAQNLFYSMDGFNSLKEHISTDSILWIFGRVNGPRVFDTLGLLGFAPLIVMAILIFKKNFLKRVFEGKENTLMLAFIPGLLPFWIILVPLNLIIWMKGISMSSEVFWRFCYLTQFWISISYFFYRIESKFTPKLLTLFSKS